MEPSQESSSEACLDDPIIGSLPGRPKSDSDRHVVSVNATATKVARLLEVPGDDYTQARTLRDQVGIPNLLRILAEHQDLNLCSRLGGIISNLGSRIVPELIAAIQPSDEEKGYPSPQLVTHVVKILGQIGAPASTAIPALSEILVGEGSRVNRHVLFALYSIGVGAIDQISTALENSPEAMFIREDIRIIHHLRKLKSWDREFDAGDQRKKLKMIGELERDGIWAVDKDGRPSTIPHLIKALDSSDSVVSDFAESRFFANGSTPSPQQVNMLGETVAFGSQNLRDRAASVLARAYIDGIPGLLFAAEETDPAVRICVTKALGEIGASIIKRSNGAELGRVVPAVVISNIISAITDPKSIVCDAGIEVAVKIGGEMLPYLHNALSANCADDPINIEIARAIERIYE